MKPLKNGNCYDANGRHFLMNAERNWKLVHGVVINSADGKPMGHCWIEVENEFKYTGGSFKIVTCIDKSNDNDIELPSQVYYMLGKVQNMRKYDIFQFNKKIDEFGTWGPWENDCER